MRNRGNFQNPFPLPAWRVATLAAVLVTAGPAQVNVLTANYGRERTNANLQEYALNPSTVRPGRFGKIGTLPVDGQVYAQPLYVTALQIPGQGSHNAVFLATQHNTVYAYDADTFAPPLLLWSVNLGPSVPTTMFHDYSDILQEVGILGTGAIDVGRGVLYVVSMNVQNGSILFRLHALDLTNGQESLNGPVVITGGAAAPGAGISGEGSLVFDPKWQIQRPGLALTNDAVYVSFGSHADDGPWHGWIMSYDASDLTRQLGTFLTTAGGMGGSVWQSGRAPAVDDDGNLYVITGNGDYDGSANFSESFLKLSGGALQLADWFTPFNFQMLADWDLDLSAGPVLVPGTHMVLGGDKAGQMYLVNGASMGRLASEPQDVQTIQAVRRSGSGIFQFAVWSVAGGAYVYMQEEESIIKCYQVANGILNPYPVSVSAAWAHSPYAGMAISADGGQNHSAILWETTGTQTDPAVRGTLHAFDASDLSQELWNSDLTGGPDRLAKFAKFAVPTVANGKVYVPTWDSEIDVYGLFPPPEQTSAQCGTRRAATLFPPPECPLPDVARK